MRGISALICRYTLIVAVIMLLAVSCGHGGRYAVISNTPVQAPVGSIPEQFSPDGSITQDELHRALMLEFDRLGIDPTKVTAKAPTLAENRVFDLKARVVDADGTGPELPTGISLTWTEQLVGDYDQNGEVNINDIAGIGHHWRKMVEYDEAALHGGFKNWPTGDPDADGAVNWLRARVDGDHNSEININDLTPISLHWRERLDGYRLYVKAPGETEYTAGGTITPTRTTSAPVRITTEQAIGGQGIYSLYVAPYDSETETEGPASNVITVDTESGIINQAPVADLRVTPDYAGAPAVITLDASGSYDLDGSIAVYHWDFDADGTVDWVSSDPVPEESSGGTVIEIEPQATEGVVTATYLQGSAEYYHPTVQVVDNEAAASEKADAELGLSGWETRILNSSLEDYELLVEPSNAGIDPNTGEVLIFGKRMETQEDFENPLLENHNYMARQVSEGVWEYEHIDLPTEFDGVLHDAKPRNLFWDEYGQPVVVYNIFETYGQPPGPCRQCIWTAQRRAGGTWTTEEQFYSSKPESTNGSVLSGVMPKTNGKFTGLIIDMPTDKGSIHPDLMFRYKYYMLTYKNGSWVIEFTGYDTAERTEMPSVPVVKHNGETHVLFETFGSLPEGLSWAKWEPGIGLGEPEQPLGSGQLPLFYWPNSGMYTNDGSLYIAYRVIPDTQVPPRPEYLNDYLVCISDGSIKPTPEIAVDIADDDAYNVSNLYEGTHGIAMFVVYTPHYMNSGSSTTDHYQLIGNEWFVERLIDNRLIPLLRNSSMQSAAIEDKQCRYAFVSNSRFYPIDDPRADDFGRRFSICKHVDPHVEEGES